jgi:hypothetical protein
MTVVAHITLRSWSLVKTKGKSSAPDEEDTSSAPEEEDKISVPKLERVNGNGKPPDMELKVSSIGISTNEFGDFSKCSIITDLIPDEKFEDLGKTAQEIWIGFMHQPQTGRFLVFSIILGQLCQGIVSDYDEAIKKFVSKTKLDEQLVSPL